jgi:hypothetical protein
VLKVSDRWQPLILLPITKTGSLNVSLLWCKQKASTHEKWEGRDDGTDLTRSNLRRNKMETTHSDAAQNNSAANRKKI